MSMYDSKKKKKNAKNRCPYLCNYTGLLGFDNKQVYNHKECFA